MSDIILDILRRYVDGTKIKKASARSGGEYHSPCPKCGGTDRFCVFPEQPGGALDMQHGITGTWACPRHCQEGGDAIDLLMWAGGLTFREVCEVLRIDLPERTQEERRRYRPLTAHGTDTWTPTSYAPPPEAWLTQASKLATEAHARLLERPSILSYLAKRGLPLEAVQRYGLGYIEGEDNTGKYLYRQRSVFGLQPKERDGKPVRALRIPRGITIPCWSNDTHTQALRVRIRKRNADLAEGEDKCILIAQLAPPYSAPLRLRSRAGNVGRGRIRAGRHAHSPRLRGKNRRARHPHGLRQTRCRGPRGPLRSGQNPHGHGLGRKARRRHPHGLELALVARPLPPSQAMVRPRRKGPGGSLCQGRGHPGMAPRQLSGILPADGSRVRAPTASAAGTGANGSFARWNCCR